MNNMTICFFYIFFMSVMKILSSSKLITILMSMEFMMLSIYFILSMVNMEWFSKSVLLIIFLSFMVCESVMGLGMYIYMTRISGKDQFKSLNLLK